ncbi:cell division protein FtsA [Sneathiella sp. P13V-1]|uniref:cell division protein FtsA n=1 Tax=Sneathiella sp. P13V-1 TaxID=2697366 RepID=UPI00187B1ED1|nr:cell division protein FtsA [Sneathiella sp. P13V-1]MBE7636690.1 cell division protein FtsA [Sneathiella sp. P13V-1]
MATGRNGPIAALDVGTTKIGCFVAVEETGGLRIKGVGHQVARGMRAGSITNMEMAEDSIRSAVDAAERMAGETIREVYVSVTAGQPASQTVEVEMSIGGQEIGDKDLIKTLKEAQTGYKPENRTVIHALPVGYNVDGNKGIRDPRGMFGDQFGVSMHMVSVLNNHVRNLTTCVERCHLGVAGLVSAPYAAGLASLVQDEMDLGVTVIDLGGGSTSFAVFYDGEMVYNETIPVGGTHVSNDIARGLSTTLANAERMKTLYGSALVSSSDEKEIIDVPLIGEAEHHVANHVPRSMLVGIIRPRIEEILEIVRDRLLASGFAKVAGRRAVIVGGASQLAGVQELAGRILDKQVRIGKPIRVKSLPDATEGPAFAVAAGLLSFAVKENFNEQLSGNLLEKTPKNRLLRIGNWFKENF